MNKRVFDKKLFGVYSLKSLVPGHPLMGTQDDEFICPQSRFAGLSDCEMEKAQREGKLNLLAHGDKVGYTIFETTDQKLLLISFFPTQIMFIQMINIPSFICMSF